VRVEGTLDELMYVGGPDHLLYLTQLEYKAIYCLCCGYETDRRHYLHIGKTRTYTQIVGTNERAKHFIR